MSAPYHTAGCTGQTGCRCLADHQEWEARCNEPEASHFFGYLIVILAVYAIIVYAFWGDAIASFIAN